MISLAVKKRITDTEMVKGEGEDMWCNERLIDGMGIDDYYEMWLSLNDLVEILKKENEKLKQENAELRKKLEKNEIKEKE